MKHYVTILFILISVSNIRSQWLFDSIIPLDSMIRYSTVDYVVDSSVHWSIFTAVADNRVHVLKKKDMIWYEINASGFDTNCIFSVMTAKDSSNAWLGTYDGRIFRTTNGGYYWSTQVDLRNYSFIDGITFSRQYPNIGYAFADSLGPGAYYGVIVLKTTDGGITWQHRNYVIPGYVGSLTAIEVQDSNYVWLGLLPYTAPASKLMITTNGGTNWSFVDAAGGNQGPVYIQFSDDKLRGVYINAQTFQNAHLFRTTNGGLNWNSVLQFNFVLDNGGSRIVWLPGTDNVYAQNPGLDGIFRSTDGGMNWININNLTSIYLTGAVKMNNDRIYLSAYHVGTDTVYKKYDTVKVIGINPSGTNLPGAYSLSQNYPNPFNPTTEIKFGLPKSAHVTIRVFDILGKQIAVLANNEFKPAGEYSVKFDGSNYASGIYIYRIETEDFAQSKKMVLIK